MEEGRPARVVPLRALIMSIIALAVPVIGQMFFRELMSNLDVLLWLFALVPAFLLAYYRGWQGVATSLAVGMAVLAVTQVVLLLTNGSVANWPLLFGVLVAYLGISLGVGWVSELLHGERRRAENLAMIDELTGLPNRRFARHFLDIEVAAAQRGRRLALVMIDLDNFKDYNDTYGHFAGDEAIALMGRSLSDNTRRMNLAARWGGEEFVAILSDTTEAGALHFVRRVQQTLRKADVVGGPITFSAGIAAYTSATNSAEDLLKAADRALYQAKAAGRNRAIVDDENAATRTGLWSGA